MSVTTLVARAEIRRRRVALLGLACMIGISGAVVMASVAGARRTASAVDRFLEASNTSDLQVQIDDPELDADTVFARVREMPGVGAVAPIKFTFADVGTEFDFGVLSSDEPRLFTEFDRPRVLAGRMPRSEREVVINEQARAQLGAGVGDEVVGRTFTPEEFECLFAGRECDITLSGPELALEVVGIVRLPGDLNSDPSQANPMALAGPGFYEQYAVRTGGLDRTARLELEPGADVDAVAEAIKATAAADTVIFVEPSRQSVQNATGDGVDVLVAALAVFAGVAALAAVVVIGQAISRQASALAADLTALGPLGCTRRRRALAATAVVAPAALAGAALAIVGALAVSGLFPFGLAGRAEPDPGLRVDGRVLRAGFVVLVTLAVAWAFAASWRAAGPVRRRVPRSSRVSESVAHTSLPVVPAMGARFALDPGRGRVGGGRSAVGVVAFTFCGVVAALAFAASAQRVHDEPARWGRSWDLGPLDLAALDDSEIAAVSEDEARARLDAVAADERFAAAGVLSFAYAELDGIEVQAASLEPSAGELGIPVIEGRAPAATDEVALGSRTMARLGVGIGDDVDVALAADGPHATARGRVRVVGRAVVPEFDSNRPGEGALFTPEGLDAYRRSDGERAAVVDVEPGVDDGEAVEALAEHGFTVSVYGYPIPPSQIIDLHTIRGMPIALALFFGLLGTVALAHAVLVTARRRRRELSVLQALGMLRRSVGSIPPWQAALIVVVGALVGVPLGIVVGRWVWRGVADGIGVAADVAVPATWVAILVAAALAAAVLVGFCSGVFATRRSPADVLRAE